MVGFPSRPFKPHLTGFAHETTYPFDKNDLT